MNYRVKGLRYIFNNGGVYFSMTKPQVLELRNLCDIILNDKRGEALTQNGEKTKAKNCDTRF